MKTRRHLLISVQIESAKRMMEVERRCLLHGRFTTVAEVKSDNLEHDFWHCIHVRSDLELGLADNPEFSMLMRKEEKEFKAFFALLPRAARRHMGPDMTAFVRELRDRSIPGPKPSDKIADAAAAVRIMYQGNPNIFSSLNQRHRLLALKKAFDANAVPLCTKSTNGKWSEVNDNTFKQFVSRARNSRI